MTTEFDLSQNRVDSPSWVGYLKRCLIGGMVLGFLASFVVGCQSEKTPPEKSTADTSRESTAKADGTERGAGTDSPKQGTSTKERRKRSTSLQLGGGTETSTVSLENVPATMEGLVAQLQPFQVLLGRWKWVTQKKFGDFPKTGDDLQWIWDFRTVPGQPALVARSESIPYAATLRLTINEDQFEATITDSEKQQRRLRGTWVEGCEPKETPDGKILQRTFKLQLTQYEPAEGDQLQATINLLDNDQYLLEWKRQANSQAAWQQLDTTRQQREGTSFAVAESDNPGPKCVVSGGLGTMTVSFEGKTYPVCCTGCVAAFNEDPQRWLARLKKKAADK